MEKGEPINISEINLVGGRKSAKSISAQILAVEAVLLKKSKVAVTFVRNKVDDSKELYMEVENIVDNLEAPATFQRNTQKISFKGGGGKSKIRVIGLNSNKKGDKAKKSGLANSGFVDYQIIVFEERFEFSELDVLAVKEAVRTQNKKADTLIINICNP